MLRINGIDNKITRRHMIYTNSGNNFLPIGVQITDTCTMRTVVALR